MDEPAFVRLQTAVFLSTLNLKPILDLAKTIQDTSNGLLDIDPIVLPVPSDAPAEIPRIILKGAHERWVYQVCASRLDFVFQLPQSELGKAEFGTIIRQQADVSAAIWGAISAKFNASGNRIGIVSTFLSVTDSAVRSLRSRFLPSSTAPEPHELQLHALHRIALGDVLVNRWTRCIAGQAQSANPPQESMRIEIDVNTLPEHVFAVTPSGILKFTEGATELVLNTMESLFGDNPAVERVF